MQFQPLQGVSMHALIGRSPASSDRGFSPHRWTAAFFPRPLKLNECLRASLYLNTDTYEFELAGPRTNWMYRTCKPHQRKLPAKRLEKCSFPFRRLGMAADGCECTLDFTNAVKSFELDLVQLGKQTEKKKKNFSLRLIRLSMMVSATRHSLSQRQVGARQKRRAFNFSVSLTAALLVQL